MKIGIGIAGTGIMARVHAEEVIKNKRTELVAVASRSMERARDFAREYNIKAYTDYQEMLDNKKIDAVIIANHNDKHAELGIKAAKAGKHILVEKPIDISLKKAQMLLRECYSNKLKLSVISQKRFDPKILELNKKIERKEFGDMPIIRINADFRRNKEYYESSEGWRKKNANSGGGVLINQGIHHVDIARWILGEAKSVLGYTERRIHDIEGEDFCSATIKFLNGATAIIRCSSTAANNKEEIIIEWENKRIVYNESIIHKLKNTLLNYDILNKILLRRGNILVRKQIDDFAGSIINDRQPLVTGEDGIEALKIVQSIYESAKLKRKIMVC